MSVDAEWVTRKLVLITGGLGRLRTIRRPCVIWAAGG